MSSIPGQGSTFTIRLPAAISLPPVEPVAVPILVAEPHPGKDTVLVVDDDRAVLDLLTRFLTKEGFSVATAANGMARNGRRPRSSANPSRTTNTPP